MPSINPTTASDTLMSSSSSPLADDPDVTDGVSADEFRAAFRSHAAGVAVISADAGEGPVALTATSVFSVSATPPLLVFSVSSLSSAAPAILAASSVVVHLLDTEDVELARLCSTSGAARFGDEASWARLTTGEPYFVSPRIRLRGRIVNRYEAGTSTLVVVAVTHTAVTDQQDQPAVPLVYHSRTWFALDRSAALV